MFRVSAKPDILTSSGKISLPPAGTLHARQSLRFCACHGIVLAYPVRGLRFFVAAAALKKVFGDTRGP